MDKHSEQTAKGVALGGMGVLGAVLALLLLIYLRQIVVALFLGLTLSVSMTPVVERLRRYHVPAAIAVLLVYSTVVGAIVAFFWFAVPDLVRELQGLTDQLEELQARYDETADDFSLPPFEEVLASARGELAGLADQLATGAFLVVGAIAYVVTILVVGLFATLTKDQTRDLVLSLAPERHRARTAEVLDLLAHRLRVYVFAELVGMFTIGLIVYIGLLILDIRFPLVLASFAFLFEILPIVGPWLAFAPALAVALTEGVFEAIAVTLFYLGVQAFESYVLVPFVHGRESHVPGLVLIVAILVGGALMGIVGALVAIPAALVIHTLLVEVIIPWRQREARTAPSGSSRSPQ